MVAEEVRFLKYWCCNLCQQVCTFSPAGGCSDRAVKAGPCVRACGCTSPLLPAPGWRRRGASRPGAQTEAEPRRRWRNQRVLNTSPREKPRTLWWKSALPGNSCLLWREISRSCTTDKSYSQGMCQRTIKRLEITRFLYSCLKPTARAWVIGIYCSSSDCSTCLVACSGQLLDKCRTFHFSSKTSRLCSVFSKNTRSSANCNSLPRLCDSEDLKVSCWWGLQKCF